MKIGIDISQTAYEGTGVANFVEKLVEKLIKQDKENEYVLFFSSLRKKCQISPPMADQPLAENVKYQMSNVRIVSYKMPPTLLDFLWNKLHILPIENFLGDVDVFISSDWTQPPVKKAKSVTILYDLIVYKYPEETDEKIVKTQKRRLEWVKKECDSIICISEATKQDAMEILGIDEKRLAVVYPGI